VENFGIFKQRVLNHESAIVQLYTMKRKFFVCAHAVASAAPAASFKSVIRTSESQSISAVFPIYGYAVIRPRITRLVNLGYYSFVQRDKRAS